MSGGRGVPAERLPWGLVLGGAGFGWVVLQVLRPRFFLTDDTFSLFFPLFVEVGRSIWAGKPFWISESIFGGGYDLAADAQMIPMWHPLMLGLSLLAHTPLQSWLMEVVALVNLLLAAGGFTYAVGALERAGHPVVPRARVVWLALSWTFSMYALLLGSSGIWYLANVATLPWMVGACVEPRGRWAVVVMAGAVFHGAVGGYPSCFLYSCLMLVFPVGWRVWKEGWRGARHAVAGMAVGGVMVLPFVLPAILALPESVRPGPIPAEVASEGRFVAPVLLASLLVGAPAVWLGEVVLFGVKAHAYALGISWAAAWMWLPLWRRKFAWDGWDVALAGAFGVAFLLVSRPDWLGELIGRVPVLGALRWPHKEMFLVVGVMHLWALRPTLVPGWGQRLAAATGMAFWAVPLLLAGMPSLNAHQLSRELYFSGEAARYWKAWGERLYAPLMEERWIEEVEVYPTVPWIMAGSHNFAALWGARCWTGYSATLPRSLFEREPRVGNVYGVLKWEDREEYWAASRGGVALRLIWEGERDGWRVEAVKAMERQAAGRNWEKNTQQ